MARAAASAALLNKNLNDLSGSSVQTSRGNDQLSKSIKGVGDESDRTSTKMRNGSQEIDRYSGRIRLFSEAVVGLGPALIPIGAVAIPAISGLAATFGAAAGAAGVALLAFHGVGDALKSIDAYELAPTTANLAKMREQLDALGPAGAEFTRYLDTLEPQLHVLQETARNGLLPGVEVGISRLLDMLPQVRTVIYDVATAMGHLVAEAGAGLAGPGFAGFFDYVRTDAAPTLEALGHTIGNVTEGLASLIVAFAPLSRDFSSGMESMSASFAHWAEGLSKTQGFHDFVDYVRESGPQVVELLGSLASAFVGIIRAAAPVGQTVVPMLTAVANVLGEIANSPIGPPLFTAVAALLAVNRAATLTSAGLLRLKGSATAASTSLASIGKGVEFGLILAGLSGVNHALDAVFGDRSVDASRLQRDLAALSDGRVVDNLGRLGDNLDTLNRRQLELNDQAFGWIPGADTAWGEANDNIKKVDEALAQLVESGSAPMAAKAMAEITAQAKAQGVSTQEIAKWFPQYNLALDNNAAAAHGAAGATRSKAQADAAAARAAKLSKTEIDGIVTAMKEQRQAALGAFDAVTQYADALAAARKQADKSNAGLDASTKAGRANREALSQLAGAWNNQGDAVRNSVTKYAAARSALIQTATQMGATRDKAERLADQLLAIPKSIAVRVQAYTDDAKRQVQDILTELAKIPRSISTRYYVTQVNAINKGGFDPNPTGYAAGGHVPSAVRSEPSTYLTGAAA